LFLKNPYGSIETKYFFIAIFLRKGEAFYPLERRSNLSNRTQPVVPVRPGLSMTINHAVNTVSLINTDRDTIYASHSINFLL
jgi:hypothetical protein